MAVPPDLWTSPATTVEYGQRVGALFKLEQLVRGPALSKPATPEEQVQVPKLLEPGDAPNP